MASHMQEQEAGDGTNFVLVFAGVLLELAEELLRMGLSVSEVNGFHNFPFEYLCVLLILYFLFNCFTSFWKNSNPKFAVFFSSHYRWLKAMRRPVKRPWRFYQIVSVPRPRTSTMLMKQHLTFVQQLPVNNMAMRNSSQTSSRRPVVS